jgi:flagellin
MSMRINHNIASLMAQKNVNRSSAAMTQSYARLSSGLRITRAADDAAGLGVSENLRADIASTQVAMRNTNDGISVIQIAEGALGESHSILTRMRELAMESASETLGDEERAYLQVEFDAIRDEISRLAEVTEFNGVSLLDGTTSAMDVQVGIHSGHTIAITLDGMSAGDLGLSALTVSTAAGGSSALASIDTAIASVSSHRASLGASQNRLSHSYRNLEVSLENMTAAESQIRDVDFASETAQLTKNQILAQAGVNVLAQANFAPQMALSLLG